MQPLAEHRTSPKVTIAGGGIAGMAAGLALARAGWQPVVYEQAPAFSEVGAGVQLGPNVTRILRDWGLLDALLDSACQPRFLQARSADSGEVLARMDLHALSQRYGAPYVSVHRADLHRVLQQAAVQTGVQVQVGTTITRLLKTAEGVKADITPGPADVNASLSQAHSDWAVVADGVWSRLRQSVLGDAPPRWTGHLAYRALMPMEALPASQHSQVQTQDITVWMGTDMHLVCYPVAAGTRLNVVCLVEAPLPTDEVNRQSWDEQKDPAQTQQDLQQALRGSCRAVHALIDACDGWRLWPLFGRTPMSSAHEHAQGRIALVGDAAHPMLPYLAQGAGMAIEDAVALAACVPLGVPDTAAALQAFANQRWQRNAEVQRRAIRYGEIFHAQGWMRWGRDVGLRLLGERLMDVRWLYSH
jgi:salicylate hydroxylase